jgi:protein-L-isoaspartate(D-aspartate) O-methyltransferase
MTDFTARRTMMVDTQIRPSDVTKFHIIDAMLSVPREAFVPQNRKEAAYVGENLPLAQGRVLLEARTFAKMLDALNLSPSDLVLDIGPGHGYSTAVIAHMAQAVVSIEENPTLVHEARETLPAQNVDNASLEERALVQGAPEHAPFDAIILQGGIEYFPDTLADQLKEGGRIAALFMSGTLGDVRIGTKLGGRIVWRSVFNASAPVLPGFAKESVFAL